MNVKKIVPILLILIISIAIGCKKDLYTLGSDKATIEDANEFKNTFLERGYEDKLIQKLNDTAEIAWKTDWVMPEGKKINDTLTYYFFKLRPYITNPKSPNKAAMSMQEVNVKKFLIVGRGGTKPFYRIATYFYDNSKKNKNGVSSIGENYSMNNYSGNVMYQNLDLKVNNEVNYSNGSKIEISKSTLMSRSKTGVTTSALVEECYNSFYCTYTGTCDGYPIITVTKGRDFCDDPSFWPSSCRSFIGWFPGKTDITQVCKTVDYPDPGAGGPGSGPSNGNTDPAKIPCNGDPVGTTTIARSSATNVNGGRYGNTRTRPDGTVRPHYGTDIFAVPNTPIYPIMPGKVVKIVNNIAPGTYVSARSLGNYITVEYTNPSTGEKVTTLYAHLNSVSSTLQVGSSAPMGKSIGLSGITGNAARGYSPHVHIQTKLNGVSVNPENYIRTQFMSNGTANSLPC